MRKRENDISHNIFFNMCIFIFNFFLGNADDNSVKNEIACGVSRSFAAPLHLALERKKEHRPPGNATSRRGNASLGAAPARQLGAAAALPLFPFFFCVFLC